MGIGSKINFVRYLIIKTIALLGQLFGKKIIYFPESRALKNLTAVKSDSGFWYAGNVLDKSDIAHGVLYNGEVEPEGTWLVSEAIKLLIQRNGQAVFYDIGANTGYFGVMATFIGQGKVTCYSFEPIKAFNGIEAETLQLNRLEQFCTIFNVALGGTAGKAEFFLSGSGSSLRKDFLGEVDVPKTEVDVVKLDDFAMANNLKAPDFLKIDVEGYELPAIKGAQELITKNLPVIWFESALKNKSANFYNPDFFVLKNLLEKFGYEVYFQEGKTFKKFDETFDRNGVGMFLALHANKHQDLIRKFI